MDPFEGEENRDDNNSRKKILNVDSSDDETQQIDSQFSPGGVLEGNGADDFLYDHTYLLEDAFDTQVVDFGEETQVVDLAGETQVDFAGETQVLDLAGETQVVDLAVETQVWDDFDCMESMPIELLYKFNAEVDAVSECEGKNNTDIMCETQELLQDNSLKIDGSDSIGLGRTVAKDPPREGSVCRGFTSIRAASIRASGLAAHARGANRKLCTTDSDKSSLEQQICEQDGFTSIRAASTRDCNVCTTSSDKSSLEQQICEPDGFTSIRAASIRASGLAAHARGANRNLCITSSDKSSLEQQICEQDGSSLLGHLSKSGRKNDQECLGNEYSDDSEKLKNSNKDMVGSTAVRKLFGEDKEAEVNESETDIDHTDDNLDMPEQLASDDCLAGLSYANSQEPGELSQARALEVVDRFLDLNFMEDEGFVKRVHNAEKPKAVSCARGSLDLAKSSILKSTVGECGIYDWDDTREDDGGGDFFLKKKELFFDKGESKERCLTEPRKSRNPGLRSGKDVGDNVDEKEEKFAKNKLRDQLYSDPGLVLHKLRSKAKSLHCGEEVVEKNLIKNLDEQLQEVSGPDLAENGTDKDNPDMSNIGPDTQMAAEAMETLCFEVYLADNNDSDPDKGVHSMTKAAKDNKLAKGTSHSEQRLSPKMPYPASVGVVTRQAKRTKRVSINTSDESSLSSKQCQKIRKRCDTVLGEAEQMSRSNVNVSAYRGMESTGSRSEENRLMDDRLDFSVPVAHRTRKRTELNHSKVASNSFDAGDEMNDLISARVRQKRTAGRDKNAKTVTIEEVRKVGLTRFKQSNKTCVDTSSVSLVDAGDNLQGERSGKETLADKQHSKRLKRSSEVAASIPVNPEGDHLSQSSTFNDPTSDEGAERNGRQEASPKCRTPSSTCATPACTTPINNVSPICMGDEYHKQSCRRNLSTLSLMKEIDNLVTASPGPCEGTRESRKRKDITTIRVLFSQHLDVDVVKHQKKILARLGGAVASSMSDATHFVADEFVRTRNMLEAIASGKPVVTHSWIKSCGQASCLIDEKNYTLRDARKEKEFGFSLPVSLARACQHPLLKGQKVLITPNTKPGKDILANLVKAVQGLPVERLGRSVLNDKKLPDDLLILSCEEDYEACLPFLEKGGAVYSSELLLNGIVKQKLEYERHRLFADHVKRTRSTIWVKKKSGFLPVNK